MASIIARPAAPGCVAIRKACRNLPNARQSASGNAGSNRRPVNRSGDVVPVALDQAASHARQKVVPPSVSYVAGIDVVEAGIHRDDARASALMPASAAGRRASSRDGRRKVQRDVRTQLSATHSESALISADESFLPGSGAW